MNFENNTIKVRILDIEYPLKVSSSVEYVQQVANYVDQKMREIQSAKPGRPLHQIAILAALNIADELYHLQQADNHELDDYTERLDQITKTLELGILKSLEDDDQLTKFES